jgi:hypothetical protein
MELDSSTKKTVFHDIVLDFGLVIAACIVGGAIIGSAYIGRHHTPAYGETISERSVSKQFIEQVSAQFKNNPVVQGQPRTLRRVAITDLRYSKKADQILIDFTLLLDPETRIPGTCILMDDGFGRYTGQWGVDSVRAQLLIK